MAPNGTILSQKSPCASLAYTRGENTQPVFGADAVSFTIMSNWKNEVGSSSGGCVSPWFNVALVEIYKVHGRAFCITGQTSPFAVENAALTTMLPSAICGALFAMFGLRAVVPHIFDIMFAARAL